MPYIQSGFSTEVKFDNSTILCDAYGISEATSVIESSGAYGADLNGENRAIGNPYVLNYGAVAGTLSFYPNLTIANKLIDWVKTRDENKEIQLKTGNSSFINYEECYFSSISFSADENNFLNTDVNVSMVRGAFGDGTIGGLGDKVQGAIPYTNMVPFYNTAVSLSDDVINWNVTFSQPLSLKTFCSGKSMSTDEAPVPDYVMIGPLSIDVSLSILVAKNKAQLSNLLLDYEDGATFKVNGSNFIELEKLVTKNMNPQVADSGNYFLYTMDYNAFKLK